MKNLGFAVVALLMVPAMTLASDRYGDRYGDRGRNDSHRDRSSFSISLGYSDRGSSAGFGFSTGNVRGGYYERDTYYRPICRPPVIYREPVVYREPVIYREPIVYREPVVYRQPIVYREPVVYRSPVYYEPVYVAPSRSYCPPVTYYPSYSRGYYSERDCYYPSNNVTFSARYHYGR